MKLLRTNSIDVDKDCQFGLLRFRNNYSCLIKNTFIYLFIYLFSSFIYLFIEFNSGTIKIELDNTIW